MTQWRVLERGDVDRDAWDAFAAASSMAWVWHVGACIDALLHWPRRSDRSYAIAAADGRLAAIVPLSLLSNRMGGLIEASSLICLGGPALRDDLTERQRREVAESVVETFDRISARDRATWIEAIVAPMTPCLQATVIPANPVCEFGFADCSKSTWVVDLSRDESAIRAGYSQLTRRQIRKAQDHLPTVRIAQGSTDSKSYYDLHQETCDRTGAIAHPPAYIEAIFRDLVPRGLCRVLFLERAGTLLAAQNTGRWKGGANYWSGASRNDRGGGDNRLLFDAQIMACRADGYALYDTGQAYPFTMNEKEKGLSDFKASFGAELKSLPSGRRIARGRRARLLSAVRLGRSVYNGSQL